MFSHKADSAKLADTPLPGGPKTLPHQTYLFCFWIYYKRDAHSASRFHTKPIPQNSQIHLFQVVPKRFPTQPIYFVSRFTISGLYICYARLRAGILWGAKRNEPPKNRSLTVTALLAACRAVL